MVNIRWFVAEFFLAGALAVAPDGGPRHKSKVELADFFLGWLPKHRARRRGANI